MEKNELQKTTATGLVTSPALPGKALIKAVYQFNQLRAFSLTEVEIMEWARSIQRLRPDLGIDHLQFAIDALKQGEIEYNNTMGIQNLFNAIDKVRKNEDGTFRILKSIW